MRRCGGGETLCSRSESDCEVVTALGAAGQDRIDQVDAAEGGQVSGIRAVA